MADNLTVQNAPGQEARTGETAGEKVDPARAEMERLRGIAKERHGKHLDDKTLEAIVARRQAKLAHEGRIEESKAGFEAKQAKESLGSKAADPQTRAQKAAGGTETRGADGLSEAERTQVRSDAKAAPKLPPTPSKAATAEQASQVLEKILSLMSEDGKPFDMQAYAQTLKAKPPTQLKSQSSAFTSTNQPGGSGVPQGPAQQTATRQPAGQPNQSNPQVGAGARAPLNTGAPAQQAGARPPLGQPGVVPNQGRPGQPATLPREPSNPASGLGVPAAGNRSSFNRVTNTDTALARTGVPDNGLFNAGGGLITGSHFDGMHFNWDGFFSLFLIRSQKDLQLWRKLMKELSELEGQAALKGRDLQIALTKMRQQFQKMSALNNLSGTVTNTQRNLHMGPLKEVFGFSPTIFGYNPAAYAFDGDKIRGQMHQFSDRIYARLDKETPKPSYHRIFLTADVLAKLNPEERAQYQQMLADLRNAGGRMAMVRLLLDDQARRPGNAAPTSADRELNAALDNERRLLRADLASFMRDPEMAAQVSRMRAETQGAHQQEDKRIHDMQTQLDAAPPGPQRDKLAEDLEQARDMHASRLRAIVAFDLALSHTDPPDEGRDAEYQTIAASAEQARAQHSDVFESSLVRANIAATGRNDTQAQWVSRMQEQQTTAQHELDHATATEQPRWRAQAEMAQEEITYAGAHPGESAEARRTRLQNPASKMNGLRDDAEEAAVQANVINNLVSGEAPRSGTIAPESLLSKDDDRSVALLEAAAAAGARVNDARSKYLPNPQRNIIADSVESAIANVENGPWTQAVDNAVQGAIHLANRNRKELDAMMRQGVQQAQGMINQLIQLLGMSRSR